MRKLSLLAIGFALFLSALGAQAKPPEVVKSGDWSMTLPLALQADAAYEGDVLNASPPEKLPE
jgi:hypothetical protein